MSEEKQLEEIKQNLTDSDSDDATSEENFLDESRVDKKHLTGITKSVAFLLFMIFAMVVLLAAINIRRSKLANVNEETKAADSASAPDELDLSQLRAELNRERLSRGLTAISDNSESIDKIAIRLKNDVDTLVGVAKSFQQVLSEKDAEVFLRDKENLRIERLLQDISAKNLRLQSELNAVAGNSSEVAQLKITIAQIQSQRDSLSQELATARKQLMEINSLPGANEFEDLERRLKEAQSASEFYQNRIKELEAK